MRNFYFGLDLGHAEWKFSALEELADGNFVFFNQAIKNEFIRKGEIIDQANFEEQLKLVLENLSESLGSYPIRDITLAISFPQTQTYFQKGYVIFENNIKEEDIEKALRVTRASINLANQEILLEKPYRYILDTEEELRDPIGMAGRRLDVEAILLTVHRSQIEKIRQVFKNIGISINSILPSAYAKSLISISKRDKDIGVGFLDLGAETTSFLVFSEGNLVQFKIFPWGNQNLTEELAIRYKIDLVDAEELKKFVFSQARDEKGKKPTTIKLEKNTFSRNLVSKFLEKILKKYIDENGLADFLKETRKKFKMPGGLILSGGLAQVNELSDLFKKTLEAPIKLPKNELNYIKVNHDDEDFIKFSASLACAYNSAQQVDRSNIFSKIKKIFRSFSG